MLLGSLLLPSLSFACLEGPAGTDQVGCGTEKAGWYDAIVSIITTHPIETFLVVALVVVAVTANIVRKKKKVSV